MSRHRRGSQRARGIWGRRGRRGGRAMGGRWWVDARRELVQLQTRPLPQSRAPRSQRALLCAPIVRLPPALRPPLRPHPSVGVLHASGTQRGPSRSTSSSTSPTRSTEAQLTHCVTSRTTSAQPLPYVLSCGLVVVCAGLLSPRALGHRGIPSDSQPVQNRPSRCVETSAAFDTAALSRHTTSRARHSCALVKLWPSRRAAANPGVIWGRSANSIPLAEAHVVRHGGTKS